MGIFSRKKKITSEDWWSSFESNDNLNYSFSFWDELSEHQMEELQKLIKMCIYEICCISERSSKGIEADLILANGLLKHIESNTNFSWDDQMEINKNVAGHIVEARTRKEGADRALIVTYYNMERVKVFEKYAHNKYEDRSVAAVGNRTECQLFPNPIVSGLAFYINNKLDLNLERNEKKEIFDFLEVTYVKLNKELRSFKIER